MKGIVDTLFSILLTLDCLCSLLPASHAALDTSLKISCLIGSALQTSEREELRVDVLKRVFPNEARGTLGLEAPIHSLNFVLGKPRSLAQRRQRLGVITDRQNYVVFFLCCKETEGNWKLKLWISYSVIDFQAPARHRWNNYNRCVDSNRRRRLHKKSTAKLKSLSKAWPTHARNLIQAQWYFDTTASINASLARKFPSSHSVFALIFFV